MSTIAVAQGLQGYLRANERTDNCRGCAYVDVDYGDARKDYAPRLICKIGGFLVTAFSRCTKHEEKPK